MKTVGRLIAVLLCVALLSSIMCFSVSAAEEDDSILSEMLKGKAAACGYDTIAVIDEDDSLWVISDSGTTAGDGDAYHKAGKASRVLANNIVDVKASDYGYTLSDRDSYQYGQGAALSKDGRLWVWGANRYGTVGNGEYGSYKAVGSPYRIPGLDNVVDFDVTGCNSAAVTADGDLYVWGSNNFGQIIGSDSEIVHTPTKVMENVKAVSLGRDWNVALGGCVAVIKKDNSLWMWGWNFSGIIGVETVVNGATVREPVRVLDDVRQVSLGYGYALAVKNDNTLWSWGKNDFGTLNTGGSTSTYQPTNVMTNVNKVAAGYDHALALKNNGNLYAWGRNYYGQLGDNSTTTSYMQTKIMDGVADIDAGYCNSVVIKNDGTVMRWGLTTYPDRNAKYTTSPDYVDLTNRTVNYIAEGSERLIDIAWNDRWLEDDSSYYNHDLAIAGVVMSTAAENNNASDTLSCLGFRSWTSNYTLEYNYNANVIDKPACTVGYKIIHRGDGTDRIDIVLVCCGTRYAENIFENGDLMTDIKARNDGFLAPGVSCMSNLMDAITKIADYTKMNITAVNTRLFITGHSLGGACANVVTKIIADRELFDLDSIYMYTYASPKICVDVTDFSTRFSVPGAFNIINTTGDIVPSFWNFSYMEKTMAYGIKYIAKGVNARMGRDLAFTDLRSNYKFRAHAATLYGQQYDDLFSMIRAHYSTTYFAALLSLKPLIYAAKTFRVLSAKCPVDIAVYDKDGNLCGYTKDGVAYNDSVSPIRIVIIDDEKYVEIPDDGEYRVEYIGYDAGTMQIEDQVYNVESGEVENEKVFEDVVLEEGKTFSSVIDAAVDTDKTELFVVDDEGDKLNSVDENGEETKLAVYDLNEADITFSTEKMLYSGMPLTPAATVDGLTEGEDYRLIYANNTEVGTASVTVKGINRYSGRYTYDFEIYDEGVCGDSISWALSPSGVLTISGNGEIPDFNAEEENDAPWCVHSEVVNQIVIEDGVTSAGSEAFKGFAEVTALSLPKGFSAIGDNAFSGCSALSHVYFDDTEEAWEEVTIGAGNEVFNNVQMHYLTAPVLYLLGDVSGNGIVDIMDATTIQRYLAHYTLADVETLLKCGDVNGDGVDIMDVTAIQRYLAKYSDPYHIGEAIKG